MDLVHRLGRHDLPPLALAQAWFPDGARFVRVAHAVAVAGVPQLALARWQDLQHEIRQLALQRGLRFVAVAILAPFGINAMDRRTAGVRLSYWAFGLTLLLLAFAELASLAQSGLHVREREALEKEHPELAPKGKRGRWARLLDFVSGPGFSTALYALMGGAFLVGGAVH